MPLGPLSSRSRVIWAVREEGWRGGRGEGVQLRKRRNRISEGERDFILGGKERQEGPYIVGYSSALRLSASLSLARPCAMLT